jgi:hypothetical protein
VGRLKALTLPKDVEQDLITVLHTGSVQAVTLIGKENSWRK